MPEMMKCGGVKKFTVFKDDYLRRLYPRLQASVDNAYASVALLRAKDGKDPCPEYIVVNADEPYINEIIDVLRRHGHWGIAPEQEAGAS